MKILNKIKNKLAKMMKKIIIIIYLAIAAILFASCEKEQIFPAPQPIQTTAPEPIKITAEEWVKFAYSEWINENDTMYYQMVCERVVEQPVLAVSCGMYEYRSKDTSNHLYSNFHGDGYLGITVYDDPEGSVYGSSVHVSWNTFQEDSVWRFVIKTERIDKPYCIYHPDAELVIDDFYIKF